MAKTLDDLLAEAEIKELQIRYCRACDRMDFEALRACFHPDATTDYGFMGGTVDEFIESGREGLERYLATTHVTGNQLVEVNGDLAWAEHYTIASHRCPADAVGPLRDLVTAIRYIDRLERRGGEWRLAHRALVLDWYRIDPVVEFGQRPGVSPGRRDRDDPSFARPWG